MPLPEDHLRYPHRRHGMDQDRYGWSDLFERRPVAWPGEARVALWVMPILQWFPLDSAPGKPIRVPGGLTMPYPDLRHYTNRDYGNRIGIYRLLDVLAGLGIRGSVAVNAAVARRYPSLVPDLLAGGHEIVAHGEDMNHIHHGGLPEAEEREIVRRALGTLRDATGQAVAGWLSPGRSQSERTLDILAAEGVRYQCDWANDDMPYRLRSAAGPIHAMPLAWETDDRTVLLDYLQSEDEWLVQLRDRFDRLYAEAGREGGRVVSVPLHAWVSGIPYRIEIVREALSYMLGHEGVWIATGEEILAAFLGQERSND